MKVKHLKTKTTIELTPIELYDFIRCVDNIDTMLDNIKEMNDLYMSDINNLERTKWKFADLLNLKWNRDTYGYIKGDNNET